jgi:hypothetical protein
VMDHGRPLLLIWLPTFANKIGWANPAEFSDSACMASWTALQVDTSMSIGHSERAYYLSNELKALSGLPSASQY